MQFIKRHVKFIIGILALGLVAAVFFVSMQSGQNLEDGELRNWPAASQARRNAAVRILSGTEENTEIMVACLDKMATLPDSGTVKIRDAASLCMAGVMLKDNL
jgi:hypothetical protein